MRKLIRAFLLVSFFGSFKGYSQDGIIQGYISDAESKTPLTGATILFPGNKTDNTDAFGMFRIPGIPPGQYELTISHIGYKTAVIPIEIRSNHSSPIIIQLSKSNLELSGVTVNGKKSSPLHTISALDIRLRPVNTSQDILRLVPGLFIAQHAGGGKAEQIFLRGYDIDHGTDINITVDGMPVNMVSHAHGQGYADLHFLIPETVEKVEFEKGPYSPREGNLATAGHVAFTTKEYLEENNIKLEWGAFHSRRAVGQFKVFTKHEGNTRRQFYMAAEYSGTDGWVESPQDLHRLNIMGKYKAWVGNHSQLSILASGFDSKWNASGQIPARGVRNGIITRFGSIDDTEGGNTSRYNVSLKYNMHRKNNWQGSDQLYFSKYHFNLYSNFSFFLQDPLNGDMINQRESRNILGYTTTKSKNYFIRENKAGTELGAGIRFDHITDIALSRAVKRVFLEHIRRGDIKEKNGFLYIKQDLDLGNKWSLQAGVRYDLFNFRYRDILAGDETFNHQSKGVLSPKLNLVFVAGKQLKFFLNNGIGFHSNDTRVILDRQAKDILPRVFSTDLGFIIKKGNNLLIKTALWHSCSEQEFVYTGDAGIVEPGGRTQRSGVDISARAQFLKWLFGDIDLNFTRARAIDELKGQDYVPLAPSFTSVGGLTVKTGNVFNGSLRYRFIDRRPANEKNTVQADGYLLLDIVLSWRLDKFTVSLSGENLLDREWREAQFNTESRLKTETDPVTEIHFTPGAPRNMKAGISFNF